MDDELIRRAYELGMMQLPEEISALVERVRALQPTNVLEVGSNYGGTFYLWCQLAASGGVKISVDKPNANFSIELAAWELEKRTALFQSWSANVHVVTGDSHGSEVKRQVCGILGDELLDFLFIDGDHSRAGVTQDWNDYRPLVRPSGLIALHDIRDSEYHRVNGCFVHDFWRRLELPKEEIIDPLGYWGGIGLVAA